MGAETYQIRHTLAFTFGGCSFVQRVGEDLLECGERRYFIMGDLLLFAIYITIGVGGYKLYKYIQYRKQGINIVRLDQELNDLNFQRDRMMTLHHMLTDVEMCSKKDDSYKVFEIRWKNDITGEIESYDLYIYDNKHANASALKQLAEIEIANSKPKLAEDVERLKIRSKMMGNKGCGITQDDRQENHFII
jgi:hypothetical protein